MIETHVVPPQLEPTRLVDGAIGLFQNAPTKSALKKAIKKQWVTVDGQLAHSGTFIRGGETLVVTIPEQPYAGKQLVLPLQVLYEDEHLAAVHKPAGILVSGNSFRTVARALQQNLKVSSLPDATIPQPVHRLDYATTGILLVGKTNSSIRYLNQLFEKKEVAKTYVAISIGAMEEKQGMLDIPVDDKPARSAYSVLASVGSPRFGTLNLVELKPATGRRHQLRKQLAAIGNPILGDRDYGPAALILKGKGMYLHALSLEFQHPFTPQQLHLKDGQVHRFRKIFPEWECSL
ncbi:MAG: RluA family pseudouridine synthase [Salibacteraceae bacterium]